MKPVVGITFPNHWSIKNLIHSGVVAQLQESVQLVGFADAKRIPHLESLAAELGLQPIEWVSTPRTEESAALRRTRHLQKSLLFEHHRVATESILRRTQRGKRSRFQRYASSVIGKVARTSAFQSLFDHLAKKRWDLTTSAGTSEVAGLDLLFATNPVDFHEDGLVKAAIEAGIPTHTMVPSWDNLSSKGVLFAKFDRVFVWNAQMASEVRKLYPEYSRSEVEIVGIPRFQAYERTRWDMASICKKLGLDPCRKVILYANTATSSFPDQPTVIRHLADAVEHGEFGEAQLLVRLHPHDPFEPYDEFRTRSLCQVWPEEDRFGVQTVPPADDLVTLAETLAVASVCVNMASTIALDAAACDVPLISVAYDGDRKLPDLESVKSFYDYTHQQPFLESGASTLVFSREELITAVQAALSDPASQSGERRDLAKIATPGNPADRLAKSLLRAVNPCSEVAVGA